MEYGVVKEAKQRALKSGFRVGSSGSPGNVV